MKHVYVKKGELYESGKIRILGIAPYEGMKSIMLKLAKDRDDIDLSVFVGDLHKGAEIARKNFHEDFDIIISRGGTAGINRSHHPASCN